MQLEAEVVVAGHEWLTRQLL